MKARFDLVGFDPRGVGQSTPVDCMGDQAKDAEADLDPTPDTPAEITALTDRVGATADACAKAQGELLPYVGTANAARDLDRLREAVGDDQITYLGYSYGTILGAIYADLFPDKVRAMVLDGAVDPTTGVDPTGEQHGGTYGDQDFQQAFARFAAACAAATGCSAGPDAKALLDQVRAQVEAAPLAAPTVEAEDGRKLTHRPVRDRRRVGPLRHGVVAVPVGRPARRRERRRLGPDPPGRQPEPALPRRDVGEPLRRLPGHLVRGLPRPADGGRRDRDLHRHHGDRRGRAGQHAEPGLPGLGADGGPAAGRDEGGDRAPGARARHQG